MIPFAPGSDEKKAKGPDDSFIAAVNLYPRVSHQAARGKSAKRIADRSQPRIRIGIDLRNVQRSCFLATTLYEYCINRGIFTVEAPFSHEQFIQVFHEYNVAVWPMQIVLYIFAVFAVLLTLKQNRMYGMFAGIAVGLMWLWTGIAYHWMRFTEINPAAWLFGGLYVAQGVILILYGVLHKDGFVFKWRLSVNWIVGLLFILFATILYPVLGIYFGHTYPNNPTFALPCPLTIFTFGLLLWSLRRVPWYVFAIPLLWALTGSRAAVNWGIYEDYGLLIAGVVGTVLLILHNRKIREAEKSARLVEKPPMTPKAVITEPEEADPKLKREQERERERE